MVAIAKKQNQNQEKLSYPVTEIDDFYRKSDIVIIKIKSLFRDSKESNFKKELHKETLAQQVQEQKNRAISRYLLLFGTVHR